MGKCVPLKDKLQPNSLQPSKTNNDNDSNNVHGHDHDNNGLFTASHPHSVCLFVKIFLHAIKLKCTLTIAVEICCLFHLDHES